MNYVRPATTVMQVQQTCSLFPVLRAQSVSRVSISREKHCVKKAFTSLMLFSLPVNNARKAFTVILWQ